MVNYQNGKIYKLVCNTTGKVYVGSTTKKYLSSRLENHVRDYRLLLAGISNKCATSRHVLENNDYNIYLLEKFPCDSKDELHKRERYYIESITCVNIVIPTRTQKEYRETVFKDRRIPCDAKYRLENKTKIQALHLCNCGGQYTQQNKARHIKSKIHTCFLVSKSLV